MPTTDSNGIIRYLDSDGAPTPPVLNLGMQSVSDSLNNLGAYRRAADATARAALVTQYSPTAAKPLLVYRQDLPPARAYEFTRDGVNWHTVNATGTQSKINDYTTFSSASTTLDIDGPFITGSGFIRAANGVGALTTAWRTIGAIPPDYTPVIAAEIMPLYANLAGSVYCRLLRDGNAFQVALQAGSPSITLNSSHVFYISGLRWRYV